MISSLVGAVSLLLDSPGVFRAMVNFSPTPAQTKWLSEHMKPGAEPFVGIIEGLNSVDKKFETYNKVPQMMKNMHKMRKDANPSLRAIRPGFYQ